MTDASCRSRLESEKAAIAGREEEEQAHAVHRWVSGILERAAARQKEVYRPLALEVGQREDAAIASELASQYSGRHGPTTPPLERSIRAMQQSTWASGSLLCKPHMCETPASCASLASLG